MKTVFSNSELAHVFARNIQDEGRNSGQSFYFEDGTIYSYGKHFAIAKRIPQFSNTYLMTTRGHSVTTAKHVFYVRSALDRIGARKVFCARPDESIAANVHTNYEGIQSLMSDLARVDYPAGRGAGRVQKIVAEVMHLIDQTKQLVALQNELADLTQDKTCAPMAIPVWCVVPSDLRDLVDLIRMKQDAKNSVEVKP